MEERLAEIGRWLAVNGEAIYGTRPFAASKQWSEGAVPKVDYNQEFNADYDVAKLTEPQGGGKASIEAFLTARGRDVYAILPRWPGRRFVLKGDAAKGVRAVSLLGSSSSLKHAAAGDTVVVELEDLPAALLDQPAWTLKVSR
jgi:alpha-L-fucosidase